MKNSMINGISLILMDGWKCDTRNNKRLCRVSFVVGAKTSVTSFYVIDGGETIHMIKEMNRGPSLELTQDSYTCALTVL